MPLSAPPSRGGSTCPAVKSRVFNDHGATRRALGGDVVFVKASGRIFSIPRIEPGARKTHGPMGPFRYAPEAREGFFRARGIAVRHSVEIGERP